MRQEVIISSLVRRVTQRTNLVLIALVGALFVVFRLTVDMSAPQFMELALPFLLLGAHLFFSPIPWQWTGNDDFRAGFGRGFLQALCFNAVWLGLLMLTLYLLIGPPDEMILVRRPPPSPLDATSLEFVPKGFRVLNPGFGVGLINLAFAIVFGWVFAEKEAMEAKERLTAERLRESQAQALQNQLEPHVLYNALSSLSELVYEDPLAAEEVITRLADLYRMLTVHGKADRIPLGKERKLVEAYLAMEQMRLGERLKVEWHWPEDSDEILAPPLFLQPLVENAIKHGIGPCDQGGTIVISCIKSKSRIYLIVENNGCPLGEEAPRGVGLANLESRLALWPEVSGTFSLSRFQEWTVAEIQWMRGVQA